jgi:hypothetical protein
MCLRGVAAARNKGHIRYACDLSRVHTTRDAQQLEGTDLKPKSNSQSYPLCSERIRPIRLLGQILHAKCCSWHSSCSGDKGK